MLVCAHQDPSKSWIVTLKLLYNCYDIHSFAASILSMLHDSKGILGMEVSSASKESGERSFEMLKTLAHLRSNFFSHQEPSEFDE